MNHSGKPERSGLIYVVCVLMTFSGCTALSVQKSTRDVSSVAHPEITARSYNASPPVVAQAAINAMTQLGWSMVPEQSNFPSTLVASVPMSVWTSGDTVQVVLTEQSPGQTTVDISSRTVGQMYDWGKNKENIDRFYGALNFAVAQQGQLAPSSGAARFKLPSAVIVTAGSLSQPFTPLGEVHVNTTGMINLGAALNDAMFRSPIERAVGGRTPTAHIETMNRFLREQAWRQYGSKVDAVINVTYQTEHDGDVYASGLAVQFLEPQGGSPSSPLVPNRTTEDRLKELQSLQEKGLLTPREYEQKRQEILKGL